MIYPIPVSTFIVTITAVGLGLLTNLLTRRFVDLKAERRMKAEINQHNKEKREAVKNKDKAKEDKLRKKDLQIKQMSAKVQTARLRVTGLTFIPFIALYYLMASLLGGFGVIVACSPIELIPGFPYLTPQVSLSGVCSPGIWNVSLFGWYFLSSLSFSGLLTKLLGTSST